MSKPAPPGTEARQPSDVSARLTADIGRILEKIRRELAGDVVVSLLYDPIGEKFWFPVARGLRDASTFEDRRLLARTDRVALKIVSTRQPVIVDRVPGYPDVDGPFVHRERIESMAGFPLLDGDKAIGVLFVTYRSTHRFTEADRSRIESGALAVSRAVRGTSILGRLREDPSDVGDEMKRTLDAIVDLGGSLLEKPIALWLVESPNRVLRISAGTGLTQAYFDSAVTDLDDESSTNVIHQVIKTGEEVRVEDLADDPRFRFPSLAEEAGWSSVLALPITLRGQPRAVLEMFAFTPEQLDEIKRERLQKLTKMTSVTLENAYRARESKELARIAQELSKKPEFDHAMALILSSARRLTGADSSTIVLRDKRTDSFIGGFRDPMVESPTVTQRNEVGLTRQIIESDIVVRMDDVRSDPQANTNFAAEGFLSSVGVRLQMEEERIGVLYVDGRQIRQFTQHEEDLLRTLADHASMALGWEQMLLRSSRAIERATSDLYQLEVRLDELCADIQALGFDFAAVHLIRPEENIIETVYGTGIAKEWSGRSSYYLIDDRDLRGIQADILLLRPLRTEIIRGWDDRFDRGVFYDFAQHRLVRLYMPLFITRDRSGEITTDWIVDHYWAFWKESRTQQWEDREAGDRTVLRLNWPPNDYHVEVIGTVEAGFCDSKKEISVDIANELSQLVARRATDIRRSSLHHVLEAIVEQARQIVRADSATLHFPYEPDQLFLFQAQAGQLGPRYLSDFPPRDRGLGWQAMNSGEPRFVPDPSKGHTEDELSRWNPTLYQQGIKAMAAFPLAVGSETGVLYVHFQKAHWFREAEIGWIWLLANRAADAIRHVMNYTHIRDRARQLATLQTIANSLGSSPDHPDLLRKISGNTLNLFAADLVTIYEYSKRDNRVLTPPSIAGRLKEAREMQTEIYPDDAPRLLIRHGGNVYASQKNIGHHSILNNPAGKKSGRTANFVLREGVKSAAAILLRTGTELVGVMFINFRRPHRFSEEEKAIIDALASSAALAIQNRRDLERRQQDLVTITHQLQAPLAALIGHLSAVNEVSLLAGEKEEYIANAHALAEDSLAMCHGTSMAFARAAGREMSFLESQIDPVPELKKICLRLQATNNRDDLRFSFRVGKDPRAVRLDREVFASVMYSLVHNAMKYSDEGSTVKVEHSFVKHSGTSVISIATIGEPIPAEDKELVFERFRRSRTLETTGRHHKGVGIGLWVARELMFAVGGDLTLHLSRRNPRFSQFVVHLPA